MAHKKIFLIKFVLLFSVLFSINVLAQELEDDLIEKFDEPDPSEALVSEAFLVETKKRDGHALYGFSAGIVYTSQTYVNSYQLKDTIFDRTTKVTRKSELFHNVGFLLRYSILPINRVGTDINISYSKSANHVNVAAAEITTVRGEVNLAYTWDLTGKGTTGYALLGGGISNVTGPEVQKSFDPLGYGGQTGVGLGLSSSMNFDFMYSYYIHKTSQDYKLTAPSGSEITNDANFVTTGYSARMTYNF